MDPDDTLPPPTAPSTLPAPPPSHPIPCWSLDFDGFASPELDEEEDVVSAPEIR